MVTVTCLWFIYQYVEGTQYKFTRYHLDKINSYDDNHEGTLLPFGYN